LVVALLAAPSLDVIEDEANNSPDHAALHCLAPGFMGHVTLQLLNIRIEVDY